MKAAMELYKSAAANGNASSAHNLAKSFEDGEGCERNYGAARRYYEQAANAGHGRAMNSIGRMYSRGLGVFEDNGQADMWYRKAFEAGDARGMYNLGTNYIRGCGVVKSVVKAEECFRKAAAMGYAKAMHAIGMLYQRGSLMPDDSVANRSLQQHWFDRAIEAGDLRAAKRVGRNFKNIASVTSHCAPNLLRFAFYVALAGEEEYGFEMDAQYKEACLERVRCLKEEEERRLENELLPEC